jgi:integrase
MALTSKRVLKLIRRGEPGRFLDQRGLYLIVGSKSAAHWEKRYELDGREHWHGLGSAFTFGLAQARERARRVNELLADKIDPLAKKREEKAARIAAAAKGKTFGEVAADYYAAYSPGWKHFKSINQWRASILGLTISGRPANPDYCRVLRSLPVAQIDTPIIISVLKPIWQVRPETMSRVRARIAAVLDYAKVLQFRQGDNPADAALISKALPVNGKTANHFAAVPYSEIPDFMLKLRQREGSAARALEFLIYTVARSTEAREARWAEIDLTEKVWRIPARRMKAGRDHVVPLSDPALDLLRRLPREGDGDGLVFIGPSGPDKPLSDTTLMALMRKMARHEVVHGFRSSFSDWAHERTAHSSHAIELSLAHSIGASVEKAYRRGDMLDKRRRLMADWSRYCTTPMAAQIDDTVVTPIRGRA